MSNFPITRGDEAKPDAKDLEKWNDFHKAAVLFQRILRGRAIQVFCLFLYLGDLIIFLCHYYYKPINNMINSKEPYVRWKGKTISIN
jgi:hypothetical protein